MTQVCVLGVRHTGIVARNVDLLVSFYRDLLGLRVDSSGEESGTYIKKILGLPHRRVRVVKLASPNGVVLEILGFPIVPKGGRSTRRLDRPGFTHIAFSVSDVLKLWKTLSAKGISFVSRPQSSPTGFARVVFCQDPEGNFIELVEIC